MNALRVAGLLSLALLGGIASWGLLIWLILNPVILAILVALCWLRIDYLNRRHPGPLEGIAYIGGVRV